MNRANRILSIVFLILGIALYLVTPSQVSQASSVALTLGAGFFPKFVASLLVLSSVGLLVQTQIAIHRGLETEHAPKTEWNKELKVAAIFGMFVVYIVSMDWIGFLVASVIFGPAFLFVLRVRKFWQYLVFIACVGVSYVFFTEVLYVPLPAPRLWML